MGQGKGCGSGTRGGAMGIRGGVNYGVWDDEDEGKGEWGNVTRDPLTKFGVRSSTTLK